MGKATTTTVICVIPVIMAGSMSPMGYILAAVTALTTSITALVSFLSLKNERGRKRLSVFSESVRVVLDGLKNSESQDYILSNKYYKDIETVQRYLGLDQNVKVGLVDFEKIVVKDHIKDGLNISGEEKKETKERLRKSYNKIKYFCERMEYLGILSEDKTVRWLIIKYYKPTIINSYERLRNLIVKTREDRNMNDLYEHFSRLYNLAKEKKLKYK